MVQKNNGNGNSKLSITAINVKNEY
jgi:hypothetical protein